MMNTYDLKNTVAVVTGGAQGIGATVAAKLEASGASVAIWDMNPPEPSDVAGMHVSACDVADWDSVVAAHMETVNALGTVSILVNSAGIAGPNAPVETYDNNAWNQIMSVNLTGTYHVNKVVVPNMRAQNYGRIVNIASVAGKEGNPMAAAYSASKAGVIGFTKSLGKELASHNISVNCVTPAAARTPIFDQMTKEHIDYMLSKIPRARFLETEEVANMVAWLVSAENSFTTAATFDLSGGRATY